MAKRNKPTPEQWQEMSEADRNAWTLADNANISERKFRQIVRDMAQQYGWLVSYQPDKRECHAYGADSGLPDLIMVRAGQIILAELKTNTGRVSPAQKRWAAEIPERNYRLWRPRDLIEIRAELA